MKILKTITGLFPFALKQKIYTYLTQSRSYDLTFTKPGLKKEHPAIGSPFKSIVDSNNMLEILGQKYQPTKRMHNYLPNYWKHFRDVHTKVTRVLEIGVQTDRSIKMWEEFFPNAQVYGIDILPECKHYEGGRRKIFIGSQNDPKFLQSVVDDAGGCFDIIIDDGSHQVYHQLKSFDTLFPYLSSHGIYVIEDTGAVVGDVQLTTVRKIQNLIKHIMYFPKGIPFSHWSKLSKFPDNALWADRNIAGISFYRWICFIERGRTPEDNPYLEKAVR